MDRSMEAAAGTTNGKQQQPAAEGSSSSSRAGDAGSSRSWLAVAAALQHHHQAALGGRYELLIPRGKGSSAEVWEARHRRTGHKVAIKIIPHSHGGPSISKIAREIRVMRLLSQGQHPHIIRFYESVTTTHGEGEHGHTYVVMELADGGQLHDHVVMQGRLGEEEARAIFRQVASAVLFCHRNMVAHRDLKMENVLLLQTPSTSVDVDEIAVKVVDFGFSKLYADGKPMHHTMGTPEYAAPELFRRRSSGCASYMGPQVDVWSCGVILYVMLCGGYPFDGADLSEIASKARRGEYRVPSWVSDDARDLIAGMLIVRPHKRITMADVMAHPWMHPETMPPYLLLPPMMMLSPDTQINHDEAAVEQLVTRHGFDRSSLLQSLRRQEEEDDEAVVSYQLVLATISDAATRYYLRATMRRLPPPPERQWAMGGGLQHGGVLLLRDCPCLTVQRILAALQELRIPIVSYQRRHHRIRCRADVAATAPAPAGDALQMSNDILDSLSAAVFFEIQVHKTINIGGYQPHPNPHTNPQYVVHLNRTSGPQLPYLSICSQLSSRLRRHNNNI